MKSLQAAILFILLMMSFVQNNTINEPTITEGIKNHKSHAEGIRKSTINSLRRRKEEPGVLKKDKGDFYEPYWPGGEHVFLQTTKHPGVWSTMKKYSRPLNTTVASKTTPYKGPEMGRYRDCYRDCPKIYYYMYGRVCGFRLNTTKWENEFMEFENMCTLEQENCKKPEIRPMWQAWHRGHCPELSGFTTYPTAASVVMDRARNWQKDLNDTKKHPLYASRTKKADHRRRRY